MYLHPHAMQRRIVCIHGVYYTIADEIVFKYRYCEWVLPSALQSHIKYNPNNLPVVTENNNASSLSSCAYVRTLIHLVS